MRRRIRWGVCLTGALALAALGVGLAPASASKKLNSFAGSCDVQGTVTFDPPANNTNQELAVTYDAKGACNGVLNGNEVSMPVRLHHAGRSYGSCSQAETIEPGHGAITFQGGTKIDYRFEFSSLGTEVDFHFQGARSGSAHGNATFLTSRTPPDVLIRCAGEGVTEVPMDLSLQTDSPLVSK